MHIAFFFFLVETFHSLRFVKHTESAGSQSLRLSSRKYRRAVHARKNTVFAPDRAYFFQFSAVGAHAVLKNLLSHDRFRDIVNGIFDFALLIGVNVRKMFKNFFLRLRLTRLAFLSVERIQRPHKFVVAVCFYRRVQIFGDDTAPSLSWACPLLSQCLR